MEAARVAREWIGTPFFPKLSKKGIGCDCIQLAKGVFVETGFLEEKDVVFPSYNLDGGDHLQSSMVIDWLVKSPDFQALQLSEMRRAEDIPSGCVVTFQIGKVDHHVGVTTDGQRFVHAIRNYGVLEVSLKDTTWLTRLKSVWAPILR